MYDIGVNAPRGVLLGESMSPSSKFFIGVGEQRRGPFTLVELRGQVVGRTMMVWCKGMPQWQQAQNVLAIQEAMGWAKVVEASEPVPPPPTVRAVQPPLRLPTSPEPATPGWDEYKTKVLSSTRSAGRGFVAGIGKIDFGREVWPLNAEVAGKLFSDGTFWLVVSLGGLPLFFTNFTDPRYALAAFSLFFAIIWGLIFSHVVSGAMITWKWRIAALSLAGLVFVWVAMFVELLLPQWPSANSIGRLMGFLTEVGPIEELSKILPVVVIGWILRRHITHDSIVVLAIFSGLGFAATENVLYYQSIASRVQQVSADAVQVGQDPSGIAELASYSSMLFVLVRSISCTFGHAVWSGIFAHFISVGRTAGVKRVPLILVGLFLSAFLHGANDWLLEVHVDLAVLLVVISFMLFRVYLAGAELPRPVSPSGIDHDRSNEAAVVQAPDQPQPSLSI